MTHGELFILAIILIGVGASVLRHHMRLRESHPPEDPQYASRLQALEQRVQTLERIVTDRNYDLKSQFDRL